VGNRSLTELGDTLEAENGQGQEGDAGARPPVKCMVPEIRTQSSEGKLIVHYKVVALLGSDPAREVVVFRRFKEVSEGRTQDEVVSICSPPPAHLPLPPTPFFEPSRHDMA